MRAAACAMLLLAAPACWALNKLDAPALPLSVGDDAAVRKAVQEVVAESAPAPQPTSTAFSAANSAQAKTDQAFQAAKVESCLHGNALKHTPPVLAIGPVRVQLVGLLALPHLGYAAASGKCN